MATWVISQKDMRIMFGKRKIKNIKVIEKSRISLARCLFPCVYDNFLALKKRYPKSRRFVYSTLKFQKFIGIFPDIIMKLKKHWDG